MSSGYSLQKVLNKVYFVRHTPGSTGAFSIGNVLRDKCIKLELVDDLILVKPKHSHLDMKKALNKQYRIIKQGHSSRVQTPLVLAGVRVRIKEVIRCKKR